MCKRRLRPVEALRVGDVSVSFIPALRNFVWTCALFTHITTSYHGNYSICPSVKRRKLTRNRANASRPASQRARRRSETQVQSGAHTTDTATARDPINHIPVLVLQPRELRLGQDRQESQHWRTDVQGLWTDGPARDQLYVSEKDREDLYIQGL